MLTYSEIKPKKYIMLEGEPYEVLSSWVFRKQMRKPVNQTKLRHMRTGKVTEHAFHQAETVPEADLRTKKVKYLFQKSSRDRSVKEFWFCEENNPGARFSLGEDMLGNNALYLKENNLVDALMLEDEIMGISVPIKMAFKVTEAPPTIRGNTSQGGTKLVTLETGATANVPLFVETGDSIVINTTNGDYVGRGQVEE